MISTVSISRSELNSFVKKFHVSLMYSKTPQPNRFGPYTYYVISRYRNFTISDFIISNLVSFIARISNGLPDITIVNSSRCLIKLVMFNAAILKPFNALIPFALWVLEMLWLFRSILGRSILPVYGTEPGNSFTCLSSLWGRNLNIFSSWLPDLVWGRCRSQGYMIWISPLTKSPIYISWRVVYIIINCSPFWF